ncbi:MAG: hypothetical protein WCN81_08310 [Actinomycetes bacterium]
MRLAVRWSVIAAAIVLLLATSMALVACGKSADPYSGTWLGPSPDPGSQRIVLRIKAAKEGWWAVEMGSAAGSPRSLYAARVGNELQLPNRVEWYTVDGDKLIDTVSGDPSHPVTFTRK